MEKLRTSVSRRYSFIGLLLVSGIALIVCVHNSLEPRALRPTSATNHVLARDSSNLLGGASFTIADDTTHVTGIVTPSDATAIDLQHRLQYDFDLFSSAVSAHHTDDAATIMTMIQNEQRRALFAFPELSADDRRAIGTLCRQRSDSFDADLAVLPEHVRGSGYIVQAGCEALQDVNQ